MPLGFYPDPVRDTAVAQYGPWAVITGASDGTGAEFAKLLASLGINVMLVARRAVPLAELAKEIEAQYRVQTRVLVQDLMALDAGTNILRAAEDLEVGHYVSNAGADGGGSPYLASPVERWLNVINMNCRTVAQAAHGFGGKMAERGRGGMLLMCSIAALGGQPWLAMYSATKAFEMVLAEALWAELHESHVEVIAVLAPAMDTPTFRRGVEGTDYDVSLAYDPKLVVREALAHLPHGPLLIFPFGPEGDDAEISTQARKTRVIEMAEIGKSLFKKS
jgi:short-subunit dehydrogenase